MPGFNIQPTGGGYSASGPSNTVEMRRQNRWVFETIGRGRGTFSQSELLLLESAARPKWKFDDKEWHHNQERAYLAGKISWDPITLKWYDSEQAPDISKGIYQWFETVQNIGTVAVAHPKDYKRQASLAMLDGTGQTTERWVMYGTWPQDYDGGALSYSDSNLMVITAIMRYDRAQRICEQTPTPQPVTQSCP